MSHTHIPTKLKDLILINISSGHIWKCQKKGDGVVISNSYLSFEKYKALKDSNRLGELNLNNERVHQELCRLSLIDNLTYEFEWHYWMVVTFGFHPLRSDVENTLRTAHHRFDQWLRTNNKLSFMSVAQRSKSVLIEVRLRIRYAGAGDDDVFLQRGCAARL